MNNLSVDSKSEGISKVFKGIIYSIILTLISIFIFSAILTYTNISEKIVPAVIIVLTFISILIGVIISMRKLSKNGMVNGAIVGGVYVILLYLISSILNTGFIMNIYTVGMMILGIIAGIVGGIIAVNT